MVGRWALFFIAFMSGIVGATAAAFWLPEEPPREMVPLPAPTVTTTITSGPGEEDKKRPEPSHPEGIPLRVSAPGERRPHSRSLVPLHARIDDVRRLPIKGGVARLVVLWSTGPVQAPRQRALAVWQKGDVGPTWEVAFWAHLTRKGASVGVPGAERVEKLVCDSPAYSSLVVKRVQDLTGDGVKDLFFLEGFCGSGGAAVYRVWRNLPVGIDDVYRLEHVNGTVRIKRGQLEVQGSIYRPQDPHCCPTFLRFTTLRWNGTGFSETSSRVQRAGTSGKQ